MNAAENVISSQEKEELFLQFFRSYLTFLIYTCSIVNCEEEASRHQLEDSLTNSLTLMWQIHVGASNLKMYYRKGDYEHGTSLTFNQVQSKLVVPNLQEMKMVIEACPGIEKSNNRYYLSLLEQTKLYYEPNKYVAVDPSLNADPWLAIPVKTKH